MRRGLPASAVAAQPRGHYGGHLLVVLTVPTRRSDRRGRAREAIEQGREVLRDLLRALRLFGDGRVTLGALAGRVSRRRVEPVALGAAGGPTACSS